MFARVTLKAVSVGIVISASTLAFGDGFSIPPPIKVQAGPIGTINVQGVASAIGFGQTNPVVPGEGLSSKNFGAAITNGLVMINKSTGLVQFNLIAGAYNFPILGQPFSSASSAINDFTALPEAYVTIVPTSYFSISVGQLPTLLGYTGTLDFNRMNIEGGFPYDIQPSYSRGVQVNYTAGPISASLSWNDGYFTNRYNVISGLVTYTINSKNAVSVYAAGNAGHTGNVMDTNYSNNGYVNGSLVYDNSDLYGIYYTYSGSTFTVTPEFQYMYTPANASFGTTGSSSDISAMIHADYYLTPNWSIAAGVDYETSSGTPNEIPITGSTSSGGYFGYGPGSSAFGLMITPTYTDGDFFARDELSYVRLTNYTSGFGVNNRPDQFRDIVETGFWF
ncbi:outer membrane beta-barrel protein [Acidithiobacillus caldus]|uniref:outer membrane beta-barrel protein n=1 Tax=Acidithiobacillus caldus TaxID=33059 RepID=UPI0034A32E76